MLFSFCPDIVSRAPDRRRVFSSAHLRAHASSGFTLLEVLTVIALIAVLCGLVIGVGRRAVESSYASRAQAELAALSVALEDYQRICGDYPQTDDSARLLQSLIGRRGPLNASIAIRSLIETTRFSTESSLDPFTDASATLVDPWGRAYRYAYKNQAPWTSPGYLLYSVGADGRDSVTRLAGGYADPAPAENADNLYANRNR